MVNYWALLDTLDNQWSIKLFEEEIIDEVTQAWIWADTFVQKDIGQLEFYLDDVVLKEYDDNLFFFHSNGSMTYVDNQENEEYGGYWSQTSIDTILVTFADTSTENWTLVAKSEYDWTIARDGFNETFENVTYMGSSYPCMDGDSDWNDALDQPDSYGTLSEYNTAVNGCRVNDNQFVLADFTGNGNETSRWQIIDLWGIDNAVMAIIEEEVVFYSDGTGQFETEDEGNFSFNWLIDDVTGQVAMQITHPDLIGAVDLWDKVNQDGDYSLIKTFWLDPTWSNPAPGEDEAEIASGVVRFVGFE
ncbi:hypothetical protein [Vibrio comitans]|uniref:Uncharacterized protein n=1 Tax=Vibrio comitans NBRC 102076 TaxID=1219078 RepID=A0A4Y3IR22_9VIBR|nr:hypothetical protein [Vibrio comitans]GEA61991.1 hypothetical protein VCO01S_31840 [Vibrio comitans NBRC 102076]